MQFSIDFWPFLGIINRKIFGPWSPPPCRYETTFMSAPGQCTGRPGGGPGLWSRRAGPGRAEKVKARARPEGPEFNFVRISFSTFLKKNVTISIQKSRAKIVKRFFRKETKTKHTNLFFKNVLMIKKLIEDKLFYFFIEKLVKSFLFNCI